jgi:site-specific recombinase XerD
MTTKLETRVKNVLLVLEKSGYSKHTISNYHIAFKRLLKKATEMNTDVLTEELKEKFLADSEDSRKGGYSHSRNCFQLSCVRKLEECEEKGYVGWKPFVESKIETPKRIYFQELHNDFLDYLKTQGKSKNTIASYRNVSCKFLSFVEELEIADNKTFSRKCIIDFFIELNDTWNPGSFRVAASALRSFLNFSKNAEMIEAIPKRLLKKTVIIPTFTIDEEKAIWSVVNSDSLCLRNRAIVLLLLLTGIRAVDIVTLKLDDIDWNCNLISFTQKKTGKSLTLPLLPVIGNAIAKYIINDRPKSILPFVFLSRVSPHNEIKDHSGCYYIVKKVFKLANIRLGCDEIKGSRIFRHNLASKMLCEGVSVQTISSVLGHSNLDTVDIYITTQGEKMRKCTLPVPSFPMNGGF